MSQNKDNPIPDVPPQDPPGAGKMESLLRQWGAQQATQGTVPAVTLDNPRRWPVTTILRWAPLAAGIVLAIGAAIAVLHRTVQPRATGPGSVAQELADTRRELADVKAALAAAAKQNQEQAAALEQVRGQLAAARQRQGELDTQLAKFQNDYDSAKSQLNQAKLDIQAQAEKLARAAADLQQSQTQAQDLARRMRSQQEMADKLASLNDELLSVRKERDQIAADLKVAAVQAAAARAQQAGFFAALQRQYLAIEGGQAFAVEAATQPSNDLAARQSAAKSHKLIARVAPIRKQAAPELAAVLDRVEAALTRLDGLDTRDGRATAAFARMLIDTQMVRRIDDALAANPPPATAQWLFEARLVLAGAENVG